MEDKHHWQRIRSPAAAGARETKPTNDATSDDATSDPGKRFTMSLGELSALTATIVGLTYLLGLFVFALPIRRVYEIDLTAAWYATSLVPRTVVAGQGVTGMLGAPLFFGVFFVLLIALSDLVGSNIPSVGALWHKQETGGKARLVVLALLPVAGGVLEWILTRSFLKGVLWTIALLVVALFSLRMWLKHHDISLKSGLDPRNVRGVLLPGLIIFFLVQFALQAVTVAQDKHPPLPRVEITWITDASDSAKATLTKGKLLSHTEGFWYVMNQGGQDAGLTAIPDDKVQHARIGPPAKKPERSIHEGKQSPAKQPGD